MADSTLVNTLTSFANAIREKEGSTDLIPAVEFGDRIRALKNGFPNGTEWTKSNVSSSLSNIYNANGIWVANSQGYNKGIYYSTDGKIWTQSNIRSGGI